MADESLTDILADAEYRNLKHVKAWRYHNADGQLQRHVASEQLVELVRQEKITPATIIVPDITEDKQSPDAAEKEIRADKYATTLLHMAVAQENIELVRLLVSQGADVNAQSKNGKTPLHEAAYWNKDTEIIKFLISKGADVNAKDKDDETPLLRTSGNTNIRIVRCLLNRGADVQAKDKHGQTLLHRAAYGNCGRIAKILVAAGANVNARNKWGKTPLHDAVAWTKTAALAELLVSAGADVNAKSDAGDTPLWEAMNRNECITLAKFLITVGADVNAKDNDGSTILHHAIWWGGKIGAIKFLVAHGADVLAQTNTGRIPLDFAMGEDCTEIADYLRHVAAQRANPDAVPHKEEAESDDSSWETICRVKETLIDEFWEENGDDINSIDENGRTLLYRAVLRNHLEIVKTLISKGAVVDAKNIDEDKMTPIESAILWATEGCGNLEIILCLVSAGADANAKSDDGWTLLHQAALWDNLEAVKFLVSKGADIHAREKNGCTPLHAAVCHCETTEVVQFLISEGADVNAKDKDGWTPLHEAAYLNENVEIAQFLVAQGADINAHHEATPVGTPLDAANAEENFAVAEYLASITEPQSEDCAFTI